MLRRWTQYLDRNNFRFLIATLILGASLRLQGLAWDDWLQFHPDERNIVQAALSLSAANWHVPDFLAYNGFAIYLPIVLASLFSLEPNAGDVTFAARLISALFSSASLLFAYLIAKRLTEDKMAGLLAAVLFAFSAPLLQWAHFGTTESAMIFFILVLWWLSLRLLSGDDSPFASAILSGAVLGIACGFKSTALTFTIIPLVAAGLVLQKYRWSLIMPCIAAATVTGLIFLASTPALLFKPDAYFATMEFEHGVVTGRHDVFWTWQFVDAVNGLFEVMTLWQLLNGGILILALVGILLLYVRQSRRYLPSLIFAIVYLTIVSQWHAKFYRYLAPVLPVFLVFASVSGAYFLQYWSKTAKTFTVLAFLLSVVSGLAMAMSYQAVDPRILASNYLEKNIRQDDTVAVEPVDIGAPLFGWTNVESLPLLDDDSPLKIKQLSDTLSEADWLVINSRRHWSVLPKMGDRFAQACGYYSALIDGELGLIEVERFSRKHLLRRLFNPDLNSEETRVVFDRPEVRIFHRNRAVSSRAIAEQIENRSRNCGRPVF